MKNIWILIILLIVTFSCADSSGLHNQKAAKVTFVLSNIPAADGNYSIPGSYQAWDNREHHITLKEGGGTSFPQFIANQNIEFSIVPLGEWSRPWFPKMKGNQVDFNSAGKQWNFLVTSIPLGQEVIISIDGSKIPASVIVE